MKIKEYNKLNNIILNDGKLHTYIIGFNGNDETELDVVSEEELIQLWESLCEEFNTDVSSIDYIERVDWMKRRQKKFNNKRGWILYLVGMIICLLSLLYAYSMGVKTGMCAIMAAFGAIAILVGEHIKE